MQARYDAIVIPSGGLAHNAHPHPWVMARIERAAAVWKSHPSPRPLIVTSSFGTPHAPPPLEDGFPVTEASASTRVLVAALGVDPEYVVEEPASLDTIGSAFSTRVGHLDLRLLASVPGEGDVSVLVVNSSFHMPRTRVIFDHIFSIPLAPGGVRPRYRMSYDTVADEGMSGVVLERRMEREARSLRHFSTVVVAATPTLMDMHKFMSTKHMAYASKRHLVKHEEKLSAELTKSY